MSYAVKQDMIDRFGQLEIQQLSDKATPPVGAINDVVLGKALDDADGAIDSYLAGRYTLPLASVPKIIKRYACDIARYFLWEDGASDVVRRGFDDAMKFLRQVASGDVSLGLDAANQAVAPAEGNVSFSEDRRVFGGDREYG